MDADSPATTRTSSDEGVPVEREFAEWYAPTSPPFPNDRTLFEQILIPAIVVLLLLAVVLPDGTGVIAIAMVSALLWYGDRVQRDKLWRRTWHRRDTPSYVTQFSAMIEIRSRDEVLATDYALVSFVGPWVHFQGERTTFSLHRSEVTSRGIGSTTSFEWKIAGRAGEVNILRLASPPECGKGDVQWIGEHRNWFINQAAKSGRGPGPPTTLAPEAHHGLDEGRGIRILAEILCSIAALVWIYLLAAPGPRGIILGLGILGAAFVVRAESRRVRTMRITGADEAAGLDAGGEIPLVRQATIPEAARDELAHG